MLVSLFDQNIQFQNKNGTILTNGKLYVYYLGRLALADTWKDRDGAVLNTQPIILDNNGRAEVYAESNYNYTMVVCDRNGNELWSENIYLYDWISSGTKQIDIKGSSYIDVSKHEIDEDHVEFTISAKDEWVETLATKEYVDNEIDNIETTLPTLKTELENGSNTTVESRVGTNGQTIYKVNVSDIPIDKEIDVTSEDESVKIEKTETETKVTFDLSVPVTNNVNVSSEDESIKVTKTHIDGVDNFDLAVKVGLPKAPLYGEFSIEKSNTVYRVGKVVGTIDVVNSAIIIPPKVKLFSLHGTFDVGETNESNLVNILCQLKINGVVQSNTAKIVLYNDTTNGSNFSVDWAFENNNTNDVELTLDLSDDVHYVGFLSLIDETQGGTGGGGGESDHKVAVDSNDTNADYLINKLTSSDSSILFEVTSDKKVSAKTVLPYSGSVTCCETMQPNNVAQTIYLPSTDGWECIENMIIPTGNVMLLDNKSWVSFYKSGGQMTSDLMQIGIYTYDLELDTHTLVAYTDRFDFTMNNGLIQKNLHTIDGNTYTMEGGTIYYVGWFKKSYTDYGIAGDEISSLFAYPYLGLRRTYVQMDDIATPPLVFENSGTWAFSYAGYCNVRS